MWFLGHIVFDSLMRCTGKLQLHVDFCMFYICNSGWKTKGIPKWPSTPQHTKQQLCSMRD